MNQHNAIILSVIAAYLFAAIFFYIGYVLRSSHRRLLRDGVVTKATVVGLSSSVTMGSDSEVYHPVFTFRDAQGTEHQVRSDLGTYPATHKKGDVVEVLYQPNSPQKAIINSKQHVQVHRICFLAAILASALATVLLIFAR